MALVNLNKNYSIVQGSWPNANKRYYSFSSGVASSDKVLVVVATMPNQWPYPNFTNASYGGAAYPMTRHFRQYFSGLQQRQAVFSLVNPPDGNNQLQLDFSGDQNNGVSIAYFTFTGCSGVGSIGISGGSSTPNTKTLSCSANSMVLLTGISVNSQHGQVYTIDGSNYSLLYQHNVNDQVCGVLSSNVSAGSVTCVTRVGYSNVTNVRVEIQEASAPPSGNQGNFLMMFN